MIAVVGGHSRNAGKTSVICALIRALPEARWTAIKISRHLHQPNLHPHGRPLETDTDRYLAAGASRAILVSRPLEAAADLREALADGTHAIIESNAILDLLDPDLYLFVLNPAEPFKETAEQYLRRADAFVVVGDGSPPLPGPPSFRVDPPGYTSDALVRFVRERMSFIQAETKSRE